MARQALTLRQIEVVRAVMITGTIAGAAKLLNVSAPGLSRLIKYTEQSLDFRLFERKQGRLVPTRQSQEITEQINVIFNKLEDLRYIIRRVESGEAQELKIASVPSLSYVMVPRAIKQLHKQHPDLRIEINIVKAEEALDYLLLGKGELVAMSYRLDLPGIQYDRLSTGRLLCIVPEEHELAGRKNISAREIVEYPLVGIDPKDPYGRIMAEIFIVNNLPYDIKIRVRFGATVCSLVKAGLGIGVIDEFTVAGEAVPGIKAIKIDEVTTFETWIAYKAGASRSIFAQNFVRKLQSEMNYSALESGKL
jgi:DNA-binding transcriptional LysR family regulator